MTEDLPRDDVYLPPGTAVRLDASVELGPEYGVVVHCWYDDELGGYDCYVAFFGDRQPSGKLAEKPYILRYFSMSLNVLGPPASV